MGVLNIFQPFLWYCQHQSMKCTIFSACIDEFQEFFSFYQKIHELREFWILQKLCQHFFAIFRSISVIFGLGVDSSRQIKLKTTGYTFIHFLPFIILFIKRSNIPRNLTHPSSTYYILKLTKVSFFCRRYIHFLPGVR